MCTCGWVSARVYVCMCKHMNTTCVCVSVCVCSVPFVARERRFQHHHTERTNTAQPQQLCTCFSSATGGLWLWHSFGPFPSFHFVSLRFNSAFCFLRFLSRALSFISFPGPFVSSISFPGPFAFPRFVTAACRPGNSGYGVRRSGVKSAPGVRAFLRVKRLGFVL
jgi:hypothetical protein